MIKKINCADCKNEFSYEPPANYPDKRKYCDACGNKRKTAFAGITQVPQGSPRPDLDDTNVDIEYQVPMDGIEKAKPVWETKPKEIKKENGEYQTTVYNRTVAPNRYEVGSAGNRFKLYFETAQDLKDKMKELRDAGLMDMPELEVKE